MPQKKNKRPKNLDLLHIRLPVGGFVSILHRVTGVLLVLALPLGFLLFQRALQGPEGFAQIATLLGSLRARVLLFCAVILLTHHFLAGVRHLLLDLDLGISRNGGRFGAWVVLVGVAGAALAIGGRLFLWP